MGESSGLTNPMKLANKLVKQSHIKISSQNEDSRRLANFEKNKKIQIDQANTCLFQLKQNEFTLKKAYYQLHVLGNGTYMTTINPGKDIHYQLVENVPYSCKVSTFK
jgi:hypothetical protein